MRILKQAMKKFLHHMIKLENVCQDYNSVDDYDSEAEQNC